jgi:hypothetical protein
MIVAMLVSIVICELLVWVAYKIVEIRAAGKVLILY